MPHVRAKFDAAKVKPEDCKSLADIVRFPFATKADLRDTYPFGLFAVPREQIMRLHASSGTTGKATVVGYTKADLDLWSDLMARCMACAGARPGDIVHNGYGYGLFTGGLGAHYGAERLGCTVVPVSGGMTERQVTLLQDFGAHVLCATPSYALNIAEVAEGMGVDIRKLPLRIGIFGAEPWSDAMRRDLEARLGITAVDLYGLSEIIGPGVAVECDVARNGLHGWEDHFLFEVIDPKTLEPVKDGDPGELVITTLTKEALPMVRYRSRDITTADARALRLRPHACAHHARHRPRRRHADHPRRQRVPLAGRGGAGGTARHRAALPARADPRGRTRLDDRGGRDDAGRRSRLREKSAADVAHQIKSRIGVTCTVDVKSPGEVPRSQGKAVRVKDLRKKN